MSAANTPDPVTQLEEERIKIEQQQMGVANLQRRYRNDLQTETPDSSRRIRLEADLRLMDPLARRLAHELDEVLRRLKQMRTA